MRSTLKVHCYSRIAYKFYQMLILRNHVCFVGKVVDCNHDVFYMLGYDKKDLVGNNVSIIMPPEVAELHDSYLARYYESGMCIYI